MSDYLELDIGKFRPSRFDIRREQRELAAEAERQELRSLAMTQATLTARRAHLARKMYQGEAISLDDWPALGLLTPAERGRIIADVRRVFGLRPDGKKL